MTVLDELHPKLAVLLRQLGCCLVEERRSESFGNLLAVVRCDGFMLRAVRDRGTFMVDLSQLQDGPWHSAEHILELITGRECTDVVEALEVNYRQVAELLGTGLNHRGYISFKKSKADQAARRLFPGEGDTKGADSQ